MNDHNLLAQAIGTLMLCVLPLVSPAQAPANFSGVWMVDSSGAEPHTYGEIRIVRQSADAIRVAMIDYGTAWIAGRFRAVVRVMPWTFPLGEWAPRRGGAYSSQPRARARWTAAGLLLEKSTERGTSDVDRLWRAENGETLVEGIGTQRLTFHRVGNGAALPVRSGIDVQVSADRLRVLITCPEMNCQVVEFLSGREVGTARLPRAAVATYGLDAELRIQPAP
jgi:hypothetical protein